VAAGRNKPARSVAEQTVEGVRNAEGGTIGREWDSGRKWTPPIDAAMREGTPREALIGARMVARLFGAQWAGRKP